MRVNVRFDVDIPIDSATDDEIEEWLRFYLHDNGSMSMKNPLTSKEVEPVFGTFDLTFK